MAERNILVHVSRVYLIIYLAFLIRSTFQSNKNLHKGYNSSEISESLDVLVKDKDSSEIAPNVNVGNNSYLINEDDYTEDPIYSANTTYRTSSGLKGNVTKNSSISNLLNSVTSLLQRSYQIFGVQKNKTYEIRSVSNKIISQNTTKHLLQENSSNKGVDFNTESQSNANILIAKTNFTTERNRIDHKDSVKEPQYKSIGENVSLTRNYASVGRFSKCQNNLTIHESIFECNSNVTNVSSRKNSTHIESGLNSRNESFVKETQYIHAMKPITDLNNNLMREFIEISNNFSLKLYKFMSSVYPNFIFSPLSVSVLLTLLLRASSGNSYNEIYNTIELNKSNLNSSSVQNSVEHVIHYFQLSSNSLAGLELGMNNGICLKDGTKIMTKFLRDSYKYFGAKVKGINFKLGHNRADTVIAKWIKDNTKSHLLRSKIMLDSFKADTSIVVFNNIYLAAQWIPDFENSLLIKRDFYALGSRIIRTQFIQKATTLRTVSSQLFKSSVLEIPFHSDNDQKKFVLIIILPQNNHSIESVENEIFKDTNLFFRELSNMSSHFINVMLPQQFIHPECWRLDRILPHIGIKSVFQPETSLLTRISAFENMHISRIYHESYFQFKTSNSHIFDGSQSNQSLDNHKLAVDESDFIANRPFLYFVIEKSSTAFIFMGRVNII